jgi:hypothetical protein
LTINPEEERSAQQGGYPTGRLSAEFNSDLYAKKKSGYRECNGGQPARINALRQEVLYESVYIRQKRGLREQKILIGAQAFVDKFAPVQIPALVRIKSAQKNEHDAMDQEKGYPPRNKDIPNGSSRITPHSDLSFWNLRS